MSIACAACRATVPVNPERVGQQVRCPWCGASFVASPAAKRPARASGGQVGGVIAVGCTLALFLLLLLGLCWHLMSQRGGAQVQEVAATSPPPRSPKPKRASPRPPDPEPEPEADAAHPPALPDDLARPRVAPRPGPPLMAVPRFATFMGTRASGRRFCIIADTSGSMSLNNRMGRLKDELKRTLGDLADDQECHVIVFHSVAEPMPVKGWLRGGKEVERLLPWIDGQTPRGGTEPMPAFTLAFGLEPRPDAIFFMTDGLIPANVPQGVARLNGTGPARVPINTILFGGDEVALVPGRTVSKKVQAMMEKARRQAEALLEQIAKDSGGSHRFVPDVVAEKMP
jgi:hypothetical protein